MNALTVQAKAARIAQGTSHVSQTRINTVWHQRAHRMVRRWFGEFYGDTDAARRVDVWAWADRSKWPKQVEPDAVADPPT